MTSSECYICLIKLFERQEVMIERCVYLTYSSFNELIYLITNMNDELVHQNEWLDLSLM